MFFTSISQIMTDSVDITLVIRKTNGQLTVSTLPKANRLKDEAQNHIIPLTLTGTPEEMDAGFLQAMAQPVRKAMGLISNMVEFEKQTDIAAANSKAAKDAKSKESKEEKEKREKYDRLIKKAEEMITSRKHRDAINALQQARIYATTENQKSIDEKIAEQKKALSQGSLFDMMDDTPAPQQQHAVQTQIQTINTSRQAPQQQTMMQPIQHPMQQRHVQHPTHPQPITTQQCEHQNASQQYNYQQGEIPMFQQNEQEYAAESQEQTYIYNEGPSYRPEDYEEYPDFPQHMLESNYHQTYANTL